MNKIKIFLERNGLHVLLLPLFFIVHNYEQYSGLVSTDVALRLGAIIMLSVLLLVLFLLVCVKNVDKTLLLVTLLIFILLFFGVIKDFIQYSINAKAIAKYSVFLPGTCVFAIVVIRGILKRNNFKKTNLFLNIVLISFVLIDIVQLATLNSSTFLQTNLLVKDNPLQRISASPNQARPDVYYLVFDSYPGSSFLKTYMDFDNSDFNQFLIENGFYVVNNPKSNYNRTAFSIASTLNFQYLEKVRPNTIVSPKDYAQANLTIRYAAVPDFFQEQKYHFYNLSVFDIDTIKAIRKETFLTMSEEDIFLYNTLFERLKTDLLWHLITGKHAIPIVKQFFQDRARQHQRQHVQKREHNRTVLDSLLKIINHNPSPKFVYGHFYLPHPPFFYDEYGRENKLPAILTESSLKNKGLFLSYLKYTNNVIIQIVATIKNRTGYEPVIIIESDHGYRDYLDTPDCSFTNFAAYYFPDHNYSTLYDTLSNINTFPVVLNKFFDTKIPLKKDSTIYLAN